MIKYDRIIDELNLLINTLQEIRNESSFREDTEVITRHLLEAMKPLNNVCIAYRFQEENYE